MNIIAKHEIDEGNTEEVINRLAEAGYRKIHVAKVELLSHIWELLDEDGEKLMYGGTEKSFEEFQRTRVQ